jgi:hypothetical protein
VTGDANKNARIILHYRRAGTGAWKQGAPLFRVETGAHQPGEGGGSSKLVVPDDASLFAGSVVLLAPDTAYELRLRLVDPDGGNEEKILRSRTLAEPVAGPTGSHAPRRARQRRRDGHAP